MDKTDHVNNFRFGLYCVIGCHLLWGVLPIYWQSLKPIDSWIIILYRVLTMFIFCVVSARTRYSFTEILEPLKSPSVVVTHILSGALLTANWSLYVWAMNSGRVVQSSIGYYIEPIIICLIGVIVFHEKITRYNLAAMLFALAAVILILVHFGQLPGLALSLAGTWGAYSAIKKKSQQPAILALVYETMLYGVLSFVAIVYIEMKGIGGLQFHEPVKYSVMLLSGLLTCIPVTLFGNAAKHVPMNILGMAQYISPTISMLLGIFMFAEPVDGIQMIAFGIIWIGLVIFTVGQFKENRENTES